MATETVLRSSGVCTTILGVLNQFQAFTDLRYNALPATTLNAKYGVNYTDAPVTTPALKYFGIGTRGFQNIDQQQSAMPYPGDARCMDLYSPLPFRCIPVEEEHRLSETERGKYRMRVVQTINGQQYACYYLKLIDFATDAVEIIKKDADGHETPFIMDADSWLRPNPPSLMQTGGAIDANTNRIIVRATGVCRVTHEEIMEAVSVIHNGDSNFARISELGYYTGCDTPECSFISGGVTVNYTEAEFVQLAKMHCFRGSELFTPGSYIEPTVSLESECCINGSLSNA